MLRKKVCIIGAGPSGLNSAKYALENGLLPTIFEKSNEIGGLWISLLSKTAIWDGLYSNISYYTEQFSDHPWPKSSLIFPSAQDINKYLKSYAQRFSLENYTRFNSKIEFVEQSSDHQWKVNLIDLKTNERKTENFNYLICASGLHSKPRIPFIEKSNLFKGLQLHSSKFKLKDPRLQSKTVAVVIFSFSFYLIELLTNP